MKVESSAHMRMTRIFLVFLGGLALVMIALTQTHVVPKVSADVKAIETLECDPDTDIVVFSSGPMNLSGSCTAAMVTLSQNHFEFDKARGPEAIDRQHVVAGTDTGPGHSYYLMIFWED